MAKKLEILKWPHKKLTEPVREVKETDKVSKLIDDMLFTMQESGGIGLAANQVGRNLKILVMNVTNPIVMINPRIVKTSRDTKVGKEGCLSFPDTIVEVERYKWVKVIFRDAGGTKRTLKLRKLEARCFQHELDHLEGVTMLEQMVPGAEPQKRA